MKEKYFIGIGLVLVLVLFSGCISTETPSGGAAKDKPLAESAGELKELEELPELEMGDLDLDALGALGEATKSARKEAPKVENK